MKHGTWNGMKRVSVNVDYKQEFVIISNVGVMMNAGVNATNYLIKVYVTENLFGILVIVSANLIIRVMLVSI